MRVVSKRRNIVDNPVQSRYEIYRNGQVQGIAKYRIEGATLRFYFCQTKGLRTLWERRAFYLAAARDAQHRRLDIDITSRIMVAELLSFTESQPKTLPPLRPHPMMTWSPEDRLA